MFGPMNEAIPCWPSTFFFACKLIMLRLRLEQRRSRRAVSYSRSYRTENSQFFSETIMILNVTSVLKSNSIIHAVPSMV